MPQGSCECPSLQLLMLLRNLLREALRPPVLPSHLPHPGTRLNVSQVTANDKSTQCLSQPGPQETLGECLQK